MAIIPQSLKTYKHKSIFVRLLFFFNLFVLATILAFGYISYSKSSSLLIEEVVQSNNKYIEQARNNIDQALLSWDVLSYQISLQNQIRHALYLSEQTWDLDQLLFHDIIQYLKSVKLSNRIISDIWIQPFRYPVVLNPESKYNADYFYSQIYTTQPAMDWNSLPRKHFGLTPLGRFDATSYNASSSVITFARTVPLDDMKPTGLLYMNVKTDDLSNMLQSDNDPYPGFIYAVDSSGAPVFTSAIRFDHDRHIDSIKQIITDKVRSIGTRKGYVQETISEQSYQVVFTSSLVNDWTYISVLPTAFITEKANKFREFTWIAALICLAVGVIISYFLTDRIYRPINHLVEYWSLFERSNESGTRRLQEDELGFIDRFINRVYDENHILKDEFVKNLPALQQKFLYDMLEGRVSADKMANAPEKLQLPFWFDSFQVVVFETVDFTVDDKFSPFDHDMIGVIDQMAEELDSSGFSVKSIRKRTNKIVSIVNLEGHNSNPEWIDDFIRKVTLRFEREYDRTFTVGVGNVYGSVEQVPFSYVDALSALQYKLVKGQGSIIYVDEVRQLPARSFVYSFDTEKRIINAVKTGNPAALTEHLGKLWAENLEKAHTTPAIVHHLFHALAGTAIRTIYEIGSTSEEIFGASYDLYRELERHDVIEEKKSCIEQAFHTIGSWIQEKKQGHYTQLFQKIESFVAQNYNRDISLAVLGEAIGLSPSYLSSLFKEFAGMSFVDYINTKRIERAKLLLTSTNESLANISERVGFTNPNTFIRVFKRHEGITPGQFRQM